MLKDGTYAAWYRTPFDQGTGIVHVVDGQIWGRDSLMTYHGSCQVDGDRFTAQVSTKRHTDGRATVFGVSDELTLQIEGICPGRIATYRATAAQAPGVVLEGTLIRRDLQPPGPKSDTVVRTIRPDRLPKLARRVR